MPKGIYPRPPKKPEHRHIRTLRPDEARPDGEPRRYPDKAGYVRLRWRVGVGEYVEIREHRAVLGIDAPHVHHRNHDPADNRPGNLMALTSQEHAAIHAQERRRFDRRRAAQLYAAGVSTPELARIYGVNSSTIYRGLRGFGVALRTISESIRRVAVDEGGMVAAHDRGMRWGRIAVEFGVSREIVARVMRDRRKPFSPGRPPTA